MRFVLALMWAIAVVGLGGWVIAGINPDRPDVSALEVIETIVTLAVTGGLAFAGFVWAARS